MKKGCSGSQKVSRRKTTKLTTLAGAGVLLLLVAASGSDVPAERVALGGGALLSGVPGEGPLRLEGIDAWLAEPANHTVLKPKLPLGLAAGVADITGLDANPLTRAKIELGRQLFFDPRLSSDGIVSCASCHQPDHGYAAPTRFGVGVGGQQGGRNAPAAYNRIVSGPQFWDGRAGSLEEQAVGPIANAIEMGNSHEACLATLRQIPGYHRQFERLFPDGLTIDNVGRALASFERALVTGPTPWDHYQQLAQFEKAYAEDLEDPEYLAEEDPELLDEHQRLKAAAEASPMSDAAVRGAGLFFSQRVGCAQCHAGANFTDEQYHNLGVGFDSPDSPEIDRGRYDATGKESDRGAFKTPTLRNVALTPPYMHDGSQATLADVVAWYNKGGHPNPWLSDKITLGGVIRPLNLTDQEQEDLVAFMEALTGSLPNVERNRLPE